MDFNQASESLSPRNLEAFQQRTNSSQTHRSRGDETLIGSGCRTSSTRSKSLRSFGCNPLGKANYDRNRVSIQFKASGSISCLKVARLSKIKVRRYGNAYRVDPHLDFSARWTEVNLSGLLNDLAKYNSRPGCLLLFIGFAAESEPFSAELDELQSGTAFQLRFNRAAIRTWDDPAWTRLQSAGCPLAHHCEHKFKMSNTDPTYGSRLSITQRGFDRREGNARDQRPAGLKFNEQEKQFHPPAHRPASLNLTRQHGDHGRRDVQASAWLQE